MAALDQNVSILPCKQGTTTMYRRGCRCFSCREAHRVDERARRHRKNGPPVRLSPEQRFWPKVDATATCWLWTASLDSSGYGIFHVDGRMLKAHRWAYEHFRGPIPKGLHIDHLCRRRACVNPAHLEPVSHQENMRRARRTHCRRGHELTPENTYIIRTCKACYAVRKAAK